MSESFQNDLLETGSKTFPKLKLSKSKTGKNKAFIYT